MDALRKGNIQVAVAWLMQILISLQFILSGLGKFVDAASWERRFRDWGYPDGFFYLIGTVEVGLAILILLPKYWRFAVIGTLLFMIGAAVTHLRAGDGHYWAAVITAILVAVVFFLRRRLAEDLDENDTNSN